MRIYDFKVFFEPEEAGGYVAVCPALTGCYSQGDTVAEAMANIIRGDRTLPRRYARQRRGRPVWCSRENMNREFEARTRAARLAEASFKVRTESMRANADFAVIECDPDAEQETDPLQVEARKQRMRRTRIGRPAK